MGHRIRTIALLCCLGLVLGLGLAWVQVSQENGKAQSLNRIEPAVAGVATGEVSIGGGFALTDHHGKAVTEADYEGAYKLIFFGFTLCPDICPAELKKISKVMEKLGDDGANIQPLFISIDPARDTPEVLADFLADYHPKIVGLTGTEDEVDVVIDAYKVYAAKVQVPGMSEYTMDHSSFTFFMSPDNEMLTLFSTDDSVAAIAAEIRQVTGAS